MCRVRLLLKDYADPPAYQPSAVKIAGLRRNDEDFLSYCESSCTNDRHDPESSRNCWNSFSCLDEAPSTVSDLGGGCARGDAPRNGSLTDSITSYKIAGNLDSSILAGTKSCVSPSRSPPSSQHDRNTHVSGRESLARQRQSIHLANNLSFLPLSSVRQARSVKGNSSFI